MKPKGPNTYHTSYVPNQNRAKGLQPDKKDRWSRSMPSLTLSKMCGMLAVSVPHLSVEPWMGASTRHLDILQRGVDRPAFPYIVEQKLTKRERGQVEGLVGNYSSSNRCGGKKTEILARPMPRKMRMLGRAPWNI